MNLTVIIRPEDIMPEVWFYYWWYKKTGNIKILKKAYKEYKKQSKR